MSYNRVPEIDEDPYDAYQWQPIVKKEQEKGVEIYRTGFTNEEWQDLVASLHQHLGWATYPTTSPMKHRFRLKQTVPIQAHASVV